MYQDKTSIEIPNLLLKQPKINNKDTIGIKHDFLNIGGNEFIEVDPKIAKFQGFEINKLNIIKIKVINKAQISQRIHVLPSHSQNFQVKMQKKGLLASGMNEDVYIHFRPTEYKYYYDTIRVNTETENILIPIHAYPVLDRDNLREIFPKLIDFGTLEVGETVTRRSQIKNKIPINFDFEFTYLNEQTDIRINPIKGIIPGNGAIDIDIEYNANSNNTCICEAELKVSQFDFEGLKIKLIGSGRYKDPTLKGRRLNSQKPLDSFKKDSMRDIVSEQQNDEQNIQDEQQLTRQSDNKNLLQTHQKQSKTKEPLSTSQKTNEDEIKSSPKDQKNQGFKIRTTGKIQTGSKKNRGMDTGGRYIQEKEFIDKFNQVRLLDKNKEIKFFQCIGDCLITQDQNNFILTERQDYTINKQKQIEYSGIHRYELEHDKDAPIIEQILPTFECKWDMHKNDDLQRRRIVMNKLVNFVSRQILRDRLQKRLDKIKAFIGDNWKNKDAVQKAMLHDQQKAEMYVGAGKKEISTFDFDFEEHNVNRFLFPIQYENSNTFTNFKFDVNPRTGFDDWTTIDPINQCDSEIMGYRNKQMPEIVEYPPIEVSRKNRTGAEEEYFVRGKFGTEEPITNCQELVSECPKTFSKPFEIETHKFITPHPTLRQFVQYNDVTEADPEYYLQPEKLTFQDCLDPTKGYDDLSVVRNEFISHTPGLNSIHAVNYLPIEQMYYYTPQLNQPKDIGKETNIEKYCPPLLVDIDYDDKLTDDDSDGDEYPNVPVDSLDKFLEEVEDKEDTTLQKLKEENKKNIIDEAKNNKQLINQNISAEKNFWISKMPSLTADYNRFIQNNTNKLYIL